MKANALQHYQERMRRVLLYIDDHLDEELTVELLSGVANFSIYHFHRQFSELYGITVHRYVQGLRMKRASYRLAFRSDASVLQIALDSGYESPEAFARAFKTHFGQTPTQFRSQPDWVKWQQVGLQTQITRQQTMSTPFSLDQVEIVDFPATPVALLTHRGDPTLIGDSIRKIIAWRQQNGLPPKISATFNLLYSDPETVDPAEYRLDLCAATTRSIVPNEQGVVAGMIEAGRCAVLRQIGASDDLRASVGFLYAVWLPQSGEEMRDFPVFVQRVSFFPEVAEHAAITDIFLPLK